MNDSQTGALNVILALVLSLLAFLMIFFSFGNIIKILNSNRSVSQSKEATGESVNSPLPTQQPPAIKSPSPKASAKPTPSPRVTTRPLVTTPTIISTPIPTPTSQTIQNIALKYYSPKVLVLIFNPVLENQGNLKLVNYKNWNDPNNLTSQFISAIKSSSGGVVNFTIAQTIEVDDYPTKTDGYKFSDDSYLQCVNSGGSNCHSPDLADYRAMIDRIDACGKRNRGEIDELWVWGGPWFGFWESNLAGPNAFWYNSSPTTGTSCSKLLPIMGFNYERGLAEMLHDVGHRLESVMTKVYGSWEANENHDWNRFSLLDKDKSGRGGCGNTHFPVNASSDYDYSNSKLVKSSCEDFKNYPNLTGQFQDINCSKWGCSQDGYFKWMFSAVPKASGKTSGKLNNWWAYIVDYENAINY